MLWKDFYLHLIHVFLQSYNIIWLHYRIKKFHALRKFALYFLKGITVMGMKLIYLLFINTDQNTAATILKINYCSSSPSSSGTLVT